MRIERRYTEKGKSAYAAVEFRTTKSEIRNPDGSVVFRLDHIEGPASWSQVAADILAQKYFRKAGVPARLKRVEENAVPSWLWRSVPDEAALALVPLGERSFMLATQKAAPNSPQWFNTGLHWAYGIDGPSQGHYYVDYKTGTVHA